MSKKILITAGPTREQIDEKPILSDFNSVRYISNYSTGTFAYLIAEEAKNKGYEVCLVTGPVTLVPPNGVKVVQVETAEEMKSEVFARVDHSDCLVMAAAVADYKPKQKSGQKIKKKGHLILELEKNPDILSELGANSDFIKIGFALETTDPEENGKKKLKEKDLDLIIVNTKTSINDPFGGGKKNYIVMSRRGAVEVFDGVDKAAMAGNIVAKIGILVQ